ncbi:MAG: ABC transporter permease [Clostridium chrysemydis]|uniref:ABC transporter permease n=1 Tax=Clostridium chrysemydis TaxID=2665504 RepID=UPI003F34DF92
MVSVLGLIKNELIKIIHRKKIWISIIVLMIASIWVLGGSVNRIEEKKTSLEEIKNSTTISEEARVSMVKDTERDIKQYEVSKESTMTELQKLYSKELNRLEKQKKSSENIFVDEDINYIKYLSENNLRPKSAIDLDSNDILQRAIMAFSIVSMLVVIIISSDTISDEFNNGTIKVLITKPYKRIKIIISKFIASSIVCIGLVMLFQALIYIIGVAIKGYTTLSYPELIYPKYESSEVLNLQFNNYIAPITGTGSIIPQWELFLKSFLLQGIFIACMVAFCIMISALIKNNSFTSIIAILCTVGAVMTLFIQDIRFYSYLLFQNYYDILNTVKGIIPMRTGAYYVGYFAVIAILVIYIIGFIFISSRVLNKKNLYV